VGKKVGRPRSTKGAVVVGGEVPTGIGAGVVVPGAGAGGVVPGVGGGVVMIAPAGVGSSDGEGLGGELMPCDVGSSIGEVLGKGPADGVIVVDGGNVPVTGPPVVGDVVVVVGAVPTGGVGSALGTPGAGTNVPLPVGFDEGLAVVGEDGLGRYVAFLLGGGSSCLVKMSSSTSGLDNGHNSLR
jgi:hypothetical protein